MSWRPWRQAWDDALYGPDGFYRSREGPAGHFRTAAHASRTGLLGQALARLARAAGCTSVVDVGAGRGELLHAIAAADPALRLTGVEVAARPEDLASGIDWRHHAPRPMRDTLLIGWELLDVVPCPVLAVDGAGGVREVLVAPDGTERLGPPAAGRDLAWCRRWWPLHTGEHGEHGEHGSAAPGRRAESGWTRDVFWAELLSGLDDGIALAVDYGHELGRRPAAGTLTGYRRGQQVPPVPDGSTDITAHVALDAVAAALEDGVDLDAGPAPRRTWRCTQREALAALGLTARRPGLELAASDPQRYLALLAAAAEAAELRDATGLGAFGWVVHAVGARAVEAVPDVLGVPRHSTPQGGC